MAQRHHRDQPAPLSAADAEKARCKAIMWSDAAKGREDMARFLALETDLTADQALGILAATPKAAPGAARIAERAAGNGADVPWARIVERVNATMPGVPMARASAPISARAEAATAAPAAPAAPAPAAPEGGAPSFNYPQVGDPADNLLSLAERLPAGRPRERFIDLGENRSELHAVVAATEDALNEARARRHEAHAAVQRLTKAEFALGMPLSEAEDEVIRARAKVVKADAAITAAQARHDAAVARWNATGALHRIAVDYVSRAGEGSLRAWKGKPAAPSEGESIGKAVARVRQGIAKLGAEIHTVRSAPLPVAEAWAIVKAEVERLAERGSPDVLACLDQGRAIRWPAAKPSVTQFGVTSPAHGWVEIDDGLAMTVWLHQAALLKRLEAELRAGADDANAISTEDRRKREAEILAAILTAERADVDLVQAAAGAVEHRPAETIDPRALLGVEGPAPREDA